MHVKGHQDEQVEYRELTRIEKLNIKADNIAKTFNYSIVENETSHVHLVLPFQRFRIWINNTFITGNFRKRIKNIIQNNRIRQYWYNKNRFHIGTRKFIDWETLHKSYSSITSSQLRTITKWNTGFCGVGKQLVRYKHQEFSKCPFCQA